MRFPVTMPIFLLHGAGGFSWSLFPIKLFLKNKGYQKVKIVDYSLNKSLLDSILEVDQKLSQITSKDNKISVIGQSKGGLIGANLYHHGWNLEQLVAIASPLKGARYIQEFRDKYSDKWYQKIKRPSYDDIEAIIGKDIPHPPHPVYTVSASLPYIKIDREFDGCLYKDETYINEETHHNIPWQNHYTIYFSPELFWKLNELF